MKKSMIKRALLMAVVCVAAASADAVEYTNADYSGDLASDGAWSGGVVPTGQDIEFKKKTGRTTATSDVSFKFVSVTGPEATAADPKKFTFDMRNSASGASSDPRKIALKNLDVLAGAKNFTLEIKGGLWDFSHGDNYYYMPRLIGGNWDTSVQSNRIVVSDGAVLTNMCSASAGMLQWGCCNSFILTGDGTVAWVNNSEITPFNYGLENRFEIRDGAKMYGWQLQLKEGRSSGNFKKNRMVVTGEGSLLKLYNHFGDCGVGVGYSGSVGCELEVNDHAGLLVKNSYGGVPLRIGGSGSAGTRNNSMYVDNYATVTSGVVCVGSDVGAMTNLLFIGKGATYWATGALQIGVASNACANTLVVSNGTLRATSFDIGHQFSAGQTVKFIGPETKAIFTSMSGNGVALFHAGTHDNLLEFNCTTQKWTSTTEGPWRINIGGYVGQTASALQTSNNVVRLADSSLLHVAWCSVGWTNGVGTVSNPGNMLEISGGSRLQCDNFYCYPDNILKIKVPKEGLAEIPIACSWIYMYEGSILDIDVSEWTDGDKCTVLYSSWNDLRSRIDDSVIAAANEKLAGKAKLYWKNSQTLMLKRLYGLTILFK